jgi:hypothetical protein
LLQVGVCHILLEIRDSREMEITVPRTVTGCGTVARRLRCGVPTVLISCPAIAISFHHLRNKKVALDVEVKQSVTSWL